MSEPRSSTHVACLIQSQRLGFGLRAALARSGVETSGHSCILSLAATVRRGCPLIVMEYQPSLWRGWHMVLQMHGAAMVPLLALGLPQVAAMADALAHGACDYLVSSQDCAPIAERIVARLRCQSQAGTPTTQRPPSGLDPATRTLSLGARRAELSSAEFRLAQVFLRHPGQLFDIATLSRLAWDGSPAVSPRGVARQVLGLKRKIEALQATGPSGMLLQAVHGMGYRLQLTASPAAH